MRLRNKLLIFAGFLLFNCPLFSSHHETISPDKKTKVILDRTSGHFSVVDTETREIVRQLIDVPGILITEKRLVVINGNYRPEYPTYNDYSYCTVQSMAFQDNNTLGMVVAKEAMAGGSSSSDFTYKTINLASGSILDIQKLASVPGKRNSCFLQRKDGKMLFFKYKNWDSQWHVFDVHGGKKLGTQKGEGQNLMRTEGHCFLKRGSDGQQVGFEGDVYYNPDELPMLRRLRNKPLSQVKREDNKRAFQKLQCAFFGGIAGLVMFKWSKSQQK